MKKKFTWSNFSKNFLKAVVYGVNTPKRLQPLRNINDSDYLTPYMDTICPYPDDRFVRKYRREIEDYFLDGTNHLIQVVKKLERYNYGGITLNENNEMLLQLRQKRLTATLSDSYLAELRCAGKLILEQEDDLFTYPKTIDLVAAESDEISLFHFQKNAVTAMGQHFMKENGNAGIISMPTGSGKTRTSVVYLLKDMISRGYQVIWLVHRAMLIDQAAEAFYRFAPIIKDHNNKMGEFKMVCISGKHATVKALQKDDNLIIASVQSLCNNTVYLPNILGEKVMIVVDEAHHTFAPSYRRIIKSIRDKRPTAKLLGLTATPVRMTDKATAALMNIFDNRIIYSVNMSDLIADGTLSKPNYIPVQTNVDIEAIIEIDEQRYLKKWGEMPESLLAKVAKTNERNDVIVDEYISNKEKYGKTIIFALNAIHCDTLNEAFRSKGIRSGYVYTLKGNEENQNIIERFRHNDGEDGIDVLININILTEGSDIPDIQTVFLTRPTTSDVLLMQMVGRGMRGVSCGGTEKVNIVDFCDRWESITSWLNPRFLFGEAEPIEDIEPKRMGNGSLIPVDMIRDIVKGIMYKGAYGMVKAATLPVGWYEINDEEGNDAKVLVFQNQLESYSMFQNELQLYLSDETQNAEDVIRKYFRGFELVPVDYDIENMLCYIRQENEFPIFIRFEERDEIEPFKLAEQIKEGDLTYSEIVNLMNEAFEQNKLLILSLYGNQEYYKKRVLDCVMFPDGIVPIGTKIEEIEKAYYNISEDPFEETIDELLDEVIVEQRDKFPKNFIRPVIYWTDKSYASYFGIFYHEYNLIKINTLLNSKSIPKEVVKYVIYHECLHQAIPGHPAEFRRIEKQYPDFQVQENFLDYTLRDFDIEEAM